MKKLIMAGIIVIVGIGCLGCGGSSSPSPTPTPTAPTISSITDGNEAAVALTASTGIYPTSFVITFDTAMDDATLIADNITLTCGDLAAATLAFAIDTTNTILTITPATSTLYQQLECTLAFSNSVTNADGTALAAVEYAFTNACALDDDFSNSAATQACWGITEDSEFDTWDELLSITGIFSFGTDGLIFDDTNMAVGGAVGTGLMKSVTANSDGFVMDIHISDIVVTGDPTNIAVGLTGTDKIFGYIEGHPMIVVGYMSFAHTASCAALFFDGSGPNPSAIALTACDRDEYFFKLTVSDSGATVLAQFSADGVTYSDIPDFVSWPPAGGIDLADYHYLGYSLGNKQAGSSTTATIQSVTATGLTSATMY
jgi:hypothetical protein